MNEEISKLIEEFEARLKSLKDEYEEDKAECEFGKGDFCWVISESGSLTGSAWRGDEYNEDCYEQGNVFKTREEALFEVEKRKVLHELKQLGREFILDHDNWFFYLKGNQEIDCTAYQNIQFLHGSLYFDTEGELWKAIYTVGLQRIKKYLFGIEE